MFLFTPLVQKNDFEDKQVLTKLNQILLDKRGFVFKTPDKNTPVVLLLSGGMDSIFLWFMLLKKYGLNVYPLFFQRHFWFDSQKQSVKYFSNLFKKNYPKLFHKPITIRAFPSFFSFKKHGFDKVLDTNLLLKSVSLNKLTNEAKIIMTNNPVRLGYYIYSAYDYSLYLKTLNVPVYNIFIGISPDDGVVTSESTLTVLRALNVALCTTLGDWRYQIGALNTKNQLYYPKRMILKISKENYFPIHRAWSCDYSFPLHCGWCASCKFRQIIYKNAKIKDHTKYLLSQNVRKFIKKIFLKLKIHNINKINNNDLSTFNIKTVPLSNKLRLSPKVLVHRENTNAYLLNRENGDFIEVNTLGQEIITIINSAPTYKQILIELSKKYPKIGLKKLKKDVGIFINKLVLNKFILIDH